MRIRFGLILMVVAIIGGVGLWVHAQVQQPNPVNPNPTIISGADVGFRVERWEGNTPVGRWVVRKDGQWVETRTSVGARRLTH